MEVTKHTVELAFNQALKLVADQMIAYSQSIEVPVTTKAERSRVIKEMEKRRDYLTEKIASLKELSKGLDAS